MKMSRLVVAGGLLAVLGLFAHRQAVRADPPRYCSDACVYGCRIEANPDSGAGGCNSPAKWGSGSCEVVELLAFSYCEDGLGVCSDVEVPCAKVTVYSGGLCTANQTCPGFKNSTFQYLTNGCIGGKITPVE